MPEANDPSGVSAGYTPQSEASEYSRPASAGDPSQYELFYNDTNSAFWSDEILADAYIDPFYALARQDEYCTAALSGPDYTEGTGRPTIATPGLYHLCFGISIQAFHDNDTYLLRATTGDVMAIDEARALKRKLVDFYPTRVTLSVNLVAYFDASYADGSTQWLNLRFYRDVGGSATPTILGYTFTVSKLGD